MSQARISMGSMILLLGVFCAAPGFVRASDEGQKDEAHERMVFESKIRPLLIERCSKCHGEEKQGGGLRLDHRNTLLDGGESGAAIVPGKPEESLLIEAINYASLEMPPNGKLPEEEIALLTEWVKRGAFWPEDPEGATRRPAKTERITDADRAYWAYQKPVAKSAPEISAAREKVRELHGISGNWDRTEIDRFILAKLNESGLAPSRAAAREVLLRRVTQDVVGLPPTLEELDDFLADESPDAWAKVVDRLLDSPRYGEHQARNWLDLVRYAESDGYRKDDYRPAAWRYRDYVVNSFNNDKPYNQFVAEQIAGDELDPDNPEALIATGFYRHGIYEFNQRDVRTQWRDMLNDITDVVGDVFMATSVGCARCHDHKFDPVLQKDYFRLQAFFVGLSFTDVDLPATALTPGQLEQHQAWLEATADVRRRMEEAKVALEAKYGAKALGMFDKEFQAIWNRPQTERQPGDHALISLMGRQYYGDTEGYLAKLAGDDKTAWKKLQTELATFDKLKPSETIQGQIVSEYGPVAPVVMIPDKSRLGAIEPGFLSVIDPLPTVVPTPAEGARTSGRRSQLARWLASPDNPLTARIIVNRIWQSHFGKGLIATPNDFGTLSEPASHPELLDWLAVGMMENGWSQKWVHRQILLSAVYQQAAFCADEETSEAVLKNQARGLELDPENRLLWRAPVRRISAEQIRDTTLVMTGELDLRTGGEGTAIEDFRRSVYTKQIRNQRDPVLEVFDAPERFGSVGERNTTTSSTQSLFMINGKWMLDRATKLADRLTKEIPGGDDSRVRHAYRLATARNASADEVEKGVNFIYARREKMGSEAPAEAALIDFCHVLLNSNEYVYVD